EILARHGVVMTEEEYFERYLGFDDRDCFTECYRTAGMILPGDKLATLIEEKAERYAERAKGGVPFFPGAIELVRACAERWLLGIVSGALRVEIEEALRSAKLRKPFSVIVSAEDVSRGKPNPEGYEKALASLSERRRSKFPGSALEPSRCVAVEDSPAGIDAAHGAGMRCVAVAHTYLSGKLVTAERVVERIEELRAESLEGVARKSG
ncbi:MAG: HAD family hydrolase, partial [Vicinamibacteria bacterium]